MDPLSDVLSLLKLRNAMAGGLDVGGDWCMQYPASEGIKSFAIISGTCWLAVDGEPEPLQLQPGDCFLLPRGRPFRLGSNLAAPPIDALAFFANPMRGRIGSVNGGGEGLGISGHFALAGRHAGVLLELLPPVVHIRSEPDKAAMRWALDRMMLELREPQPGGTLIAQQLATLVLVQALRLHLAEGLKGGVGWLFALADKRMAAAITALHQAPAERWTLQAMAEHAGMSRTSFTLRFKATVGEAPMAYLTRWRMLLAADRLANTADAIGQIAPALGYESESAFSTAFKRVMGCSPRQYGRGQDTPADLAIQRG